MRHQDDPDKKAAKEMLESLKKLTERLNDPIMKPFDEFRGRKNALMAIGSRLIILTEKITGQEFDLDDLQNDMLNDPRFMELMDQIPSDDDTKKQISDCLTHEELEEIEIITYAVHMKHMAKAAKELRAAHEKSKSTPWN